MRSLRDALANNERGLVARTAAAQALVDSPASPHPLEAPIERDAISQAVARWSAEIWRACGAFEWVTLAYFGWLFAIFAIFHRHLGHPGIYAVLHIAALILIVTLSLAASRCDNKFLDFLRHWYPLPLYLWFFEELGGLVHAIFPGWFDRVLIQFDYNFAGVHPSVWLARFANPTLNDFMQFAYLTYFLYLVILPAILYSRRERLEFWTVMTSTAIANYSIYAIAVLLPVESPYHSLASLQTRELTGGAVTALINLIERFGRVHGAAFPSAHVAGSMVAILASWRYGRWLFWVCLPFFACMCVATVYGRYHYVADVLGGLAVATGGFLAGPSLMQRRGAVPLGQRRTPIRLAAAGACAIQSPSRSARRSRTNAPRSSAGR